MGVPVEIVNEGIDWPAWVQAVGSVVAIGVAIVIASLDAKRTRALLREQRRDDHIERIEPLIALSQQAVLLAGRAEPDRFYLEEVHDDQLITDLLDALDAVPLHELKSASLVSYVLTLKREFRRVPHIVEWYIQVMVRDDGRDPFEDHDFAEFVRNNLATLEECRDGIVGYVQGVKSTS